MNLNDQPTLQVSTTKKFVDIHKLKIVLFFATIIVISATVSSLATYAVYNKRNPKSSSQTTSNVITTTEVENTVTPAVSSTVTITPAPVKDVIDDWKTYSDPNFKVNFKYPSTWKVTSNNSQGGGIDFNCKEYSDFLKDKQACSDSFKSPGIQIISPDAKSYAYFEGPTQGLDDTECKQPDCAETPLIIAINETKYNFTVQTMKEHTLQDSTIPEVNQVFSDGFIPAAPSSAYSKFSIRTSASNDTDYKAILNILKSISYQE